MFPLSYLFWFDTNAVHSIDKNIKGLSFIWTSWIYLLQFRHIFYVLDYWDSVFELGGQESEIILGNCNYAGCFYVFEQAGWIMSFWVTRSRILSPQSEPHKSIFLLTYIRLSEIQFRQNDFFNLLFSVPPDVYQVRKWHTNFVSSKLKIVYM